MTYNITGRYGGFFRVLRYNVGGYGILAVVKTYLLAAWVWQDAIPSYISFKTHTSTPQHLNTSTSLNLVEALAEDPLAECLRNDGIGVDCLDYGEYLLRLVLTREDDE